MKRFEKDGVVMKVTSPIQESAFLLSGWKEKEVTVEDKPKRGRPAKTDSEQIVRE